MGVSQEYRTPSLPFLGFVFVVDETDDIIKHLMRGKGVVKQQDTVEICRFIRDTLGRDENSIQIRNNTSTVFDFYAQAPPIVA